MNPVPPVPPPVHHGYPQGPQSLWGDSFDSQSFGLLNTALAAIRAIYVSAINLLESKEVQGLIKALDTPLNITRMVAVTGVLFALPAGIRKAVKAYRRHGWKRFDHLMGSIRFFGASVDSLATVGSGIGGLNLASKLAAKGCQWGATACRVMAAAVIPFTSIASVLSAASLVIHSRYFYKTHQFKKELFKIEEEWRFAKDHYRPFTKRAKFIAFRDLIAKTSNSNLSRFFGADGALLRQRFQYMEQQKPTDEQLDKMFLTLRGRVHTTLHTDALQILVDAVQVVAAAVVIANLWNPLGFVLAGVYCVGMLALAAYKSMDGYRFENDIGLVIRDKRNPTYAENALHHEKSRSVKMVYVIKDFAKWSLNLHTKFDVEKARESNRLWPRPVTKVRIHKENLAAQAA